MNEKVAKVAKVAKNYVCDFCDYISSKESNYKKHLLTPKHKKRSILNNFEHFEQEKAQTYSYMCKKSANL